METNEKVDGREVEKNFLSVSDVKMLDITSL